MGGGHGAWVYADPESCFYMHLRVFMCFRLFVHGCLPAAQAILPLLGVENVTVDRVRRCLVLAGIPRTDELRVTRIDVVGGGGNNGGADGVVDGDTGGDT